jgi:glycosyltransferase involved in cell wall biosynthesis
MGVEGNIMRKKILVRAPMLTQSGYGEHARFVIRALRSREDIFDIYLEPLNWGQTGWISKRSEENDWINKKIQKTAVYVRENPQFDISIQVTIPNEWERLAPVNIGITAGIETTKVDHIWLEKANMMDKVVVVSKHALHGFKATTYVATHKETGATHELRCTVPVDVVGYPVRDYEPSDIDIDFKHDFNYLVMAQWGPRKNLENTIRWFVEENHDEEVGLVIKTSIRNGSLNDRAKTEQNIANVLREYEDRACSIYLLHGTMDPEEISALFRHPKIKAFIGLSHGEGFGLPLFEAAYNSVPVITTGWGGQCDFLYIPQSNGKSKAFFADVNYDIAPVQKEAHWKGVIVADSMWCFPHQGSYKMRLRQVRKNYSKWKTKAVKLNTYLRENFSSEKQYKKLVDSVYQETELDKEVDQMFEKLMSESSQ